MRTFERLVRIGVLVAAAATSACFDFEPGYSRRAAREDRGPQLAAEVAPISKLAFSADGAEVFYPTSDGEEPVLRAVRLADGVRRDVDHASTRGPLFPTADGAALYVLEYVPPEGQGPGETRLRDAFSAENPLADAPPDLVSLIAVAPSGRRLLGVPSGGMGPVVVDLDSGDQTGAACGYAAVATFSPASDAVLCAGGFGEVLAFPLAGGCPPELVAIPDTTYAWALSWTSQRILAVFEGYPYGDPVVADPVTGEIVARLVDVTYTTVGRPMEFTRDGGALAFVERECLETRGLLSCTTRGEVRVRILDVATREARTIASAGWTNPEDGSTPPGAGASTTVALALSPDGKTIAYSFGNELHVRPTGR